MLALPERWAVWGHQCRLAAALGSSRARYTVNYCLAPRAARPRHTGGRFVARTVACRAGVLIQMIVWQKKFCRMRSETFKDGDAELALSRFHNVQMSSRVGFHSGSTEPEVNLMIPSIVILYCTICACNTWKKCIEIVLHTQSGARNRCLVKLLPYERVALWSIGNKPVFAVKFLTNASFYIVFEFDIQDVISSILIFLNHLPVQNNFKHIVLSLDIYHTWFHYK